MNRLIEFLKANIHHLLFLVIELVALGLLIRGSAYRHSVFLSSASEVMGQAQELSHTANQYLKLKEANVELMARNAELETELRTLQHQLDRIMVDSLSWSRISTDSIIRPFPYQYKVARVVGNMLFSKSHYLTLDIGKKDGIDLDMGVLSSRGVVGVIVAVGTSYAKVLPLTNKSFHLNCRVAGSPYAGTLSWDGVAYSHTLLTNLPKHAEFQVGDSVVTSSYSSIFPEGVLVGMVEREGVSPNDHFRALQIRLATAFEDLKYVYVIQNFERSELKALEQDE